MAVISVFVYRLAMRWPVLRLRDDRAAVALLLSAGMLTLVIIYVPRIIGDGGILRLRSLTGLSQRSCNG